jgi:hypothetical protein
MRSRWFASCALMALAVTLLVIAPAFADPVKLAAGDPFPPVVADSVAGTHVTLPGDRHGMPFIAIFGFSQKAGEASEQWSRALFKAVPPDVAIYAIADLSRVPGLFRGFAISGIRREASPAQPEHRDHVLLLTRGNFWSQIVPSGSDDDAVIVVVDRTGTVTDIERRPYSDAAVLDMTKSMAKWVTEAVGGPSMSANDSSIHQSIEALVAEEHQLWKNGEDGSLDAAGRQRLAEIGVQLDRFYDLLHQRQGLRDAGSDPGRATMRSAKTVEGYVE